MFQVENWMGEKRGRGGGSSFLLQKIFSQAGWGNNKTQDRTFSGITKGRRRGGRGIGKKGRKKGIHRFYRR